MSQTNESDVRGKRRQRSVFSGTAHGQVLVTSEHLGSRISFSKRYLAPLIARMVRRVSKSDFGDSDSNGSFEPIPYNSWVDDEDDDACCYGPFNAIADVDGNVLNAFSYQGKMLGFNALHIARSIAEDCNDRLLEEFWFEIDEESTSGNPLSHGSVKFGIVCPSERALEIDMAFDIAKTAWIYCQATRTQILFDLEKRLIIITKHEIEHSLDECDFTDDWLYYKDREDSYYEFDNVAGVYSRIWPDGILTEFELSDEDAREKFAAALKPVADFASIVSSVAFYRDSDDVNENGITFCAISEHGDIQEFEGLARFRSFKTGRNILVFTNAAETRGPLKLYASIYNPLQWRTLAEDQPCALDLYRLSDPRDFEVVKAAIVPDLCKYPDKLLSQLSFDVALPNDAYIAKDSDDSVGCV